MKSAAIGTRATRRRWRLEFAGRTLAALVGITLVLTAGQALTIRAATHADGRRSAIAVVRERVVTRRRNHAVAIYAARETREIEPRRYRDENEEHDRRDDRERQWRPDAET